MVTLLPLLLACARPLDIQYTDQWTPTGEVCDWDTVDDPRGDMDLWTEPAGEPVYPSEACVDAVLADFHLDTEAFLDIWGIEDLYAGVYGRSAFDSIALDKVLWSTRLLFAVDLGPVDELHSSSLVHEDYVALVREAAEESGVDTVSAALYNFVTSVVLRTVTGAELDGLCASFTVETRTLILSGMNCGGGFDWVSMLIHEARHAWNYEHVECINPYGHAWCDEELDGGYGFALATWVQGYNHDAERAEAYRYQPFSLMNHCLSLQDELGRVLEEYEDIDLSTQ